MTDEAKRQPFRMTRVAELNSSLTRDADTEADADPVYRFKLTGAAENRLGDTTNIRGLQHRAELPILYNHDQRGVPLGVWRNFSRDDDYIYADAIFDREDEFARRIAGKVARGFMTDCSIGFIPIRETPRFPDDESFSDSWGYFGPMHLEEARLLEISIVTVPADETATLVRRYESRRRDRRERIEAQMSGRIRAVQTAADAVLARRLANCERELRDA